MNATLTITCANGHEWTADVDGIAPGAVLDINEIGTCPECGGGPEKIKLPFGELVRARPNE